MRSRNRTRLSLVILVIPALVFGADVDKGLAAYNEGDYETAMAECLPLAEEGNATAQFCVAQMYANGFGVDMDDALALKWYGAAAEQGHGESQFNIAVFHANGWGVPMSGAEAMSWYRRSAENGFVQAQTTLAKNYHLARGVEQDYVEAYKWYEIATIFGDADSKLSLAEIAAQMSPEQLATAQEMTQSWLAEHGGELTGADQVD
jgi:uncharacterized protein